MSGRRRGADFSHLLESYCNASDCRSHLHRAVQDRLSATESDADADQTYAGDRKITSNSSNSNTSEASSFESPILTSQSVKPESQRTPCGGLSTPKQRTNAVAKKIYRKTPLNMFKKTLQGNDQGDFPRSPRSPKSTRKFVYRDNFIDEQPYSLRRMENRDDRSSGGSDASELTREKSEQQLASLDDSLSLNFETFDSHQAYTAQEHEKTRSPESQEDCYHLKIRIDLPNVKYREINTNLQTESPTASKTPKTPRNKLFVTPGKNSSIKTHSTKPKTFFPGMDADIQRDKSQKIVKSLHAPGIYRLGTDVNTVVSPVSMYISGTDIKLIQNVQSRNNEKLLTPSKAATSKEKLAFKLSAKNKPPWNSPRKHCHFSQKSDSESQSDDNDENKREPVFALPKAAYELPAQVRTVERSPTNVGGERIRGLLRSMQNRLVIRHGEKRHGKYEDADVPESVSDTSIHVLKSAEKTNYMNRRK